MFYLYAHGGSANHGCEAIVRSTCALLPNKPILFSNNIEQDINYGIDTLCDIQENNQATIKRGTPEWFLSSVETKITGKYDLCLKFQHKYMLSQVRKGDIWFSIGGDNYCYAGTDLIAGMNKWIRKSGAKNVLWGCSVEPDLLKNPNIAKDIAGFDLITARETISFEALKSINTNTILVVDPAFTLDKTELPLPDGWIAGNTIGVNASPLILQSAKDGDLAFDAYRCLIRRILKNTDSAVALIPHVVIPNNDDREPLNKLYDEFKDTGRVIMIEDHNCCELKGYISRCRMFIGARTHATIAAYSTCVPTLVLGYSVKSKGIAKDLFGTDENYVLPVQNIQNPEELANGFDWLLANEASIHNHLIETMPDYIAKAKFAVDAVNKLK